MWNEAEMRLIHRVDVGVHPIVVINSHDNQILDHCIIHVLCGPQALSSILDEVS